MLVTVAKEAPVIRTETKVEKSRLFPEVIMEENEEDPVSPVINTPN